MPNLKFHPQISTRDLGPEILLGGGVKFTAWAPEKSSVEATIQPPRGRERRILFEKDEKGYFIGFDAEGAAGDRYTISVDGKAGLPDIASRFQPCGLFGPSEVVDAGKFVWQAKDWRRPPWQGQVIYELHIGTFTKDGTFQSAIRRLDHLVDLGITVVEVMPVAECSGERNWGYDGVLLFAPYHAYGSPDDMRAFVDACHLRGIAVMLDVVYNHIGAVGDVTDAYSKYFSHVEDDGAWGKSFDLEGDNSGPVRHFLLQNVRYWLEDFRIDGFRLDATHAIRDRSEKHLLAEISELASAHAAFVTAEDERNKADFLRPASEGGIQLDAVWADDFHHSARVMLTKESHSYYGNYEGSIRELAETLQHGWYYRGQKNSRNLRGRGTACQHVAPERFIHCISNHDQVGNRPFGERLHQTISPESYRALSLFFCLMPYTPLLFMGQEWSAGSPFLYFTDHPPDFGKLVSEGRQREFGFAAQEHGSAIPDCQADKTFNASKLDWAELSRPPHSGVLALYRDALRLRRELFGGSNPARQLWRTETSSEHLSLIYQLPLGMIEVAFWPFARRPGNANEISKLLLRSGDERYGPVDDSAAETIILRREG